MELVFPQGVFLVGPVEPVTDFNAAVRADGSRPQQTDKDTGLPVWQVQVVDADADSTKAQRTLSVKIPARVQLVPPENKTGFPFTPVAFTGLPALPYVEETGNGRARIAWSFRAEGIETPGSAVKPTQGRPSGEPGKDAV
ncbi:hypothetical protein SAMN05421595_2137 [Austwickia chelonae]|uniref:Plasmid replication, integration and excision activator n=1 Tax=Austwickia chelonae NBRC 105200 TaxID=1184607 RepID=K6UL77_9MICO|nr:hypothetical protein [Austwickia chelonae]GAB77001.1 hypothetical protein AUCHE_04_00420 [Austwickia chelonae NBRC 105200]SEW33185.1 hypothetical protein SAMN05421595_2137 [Austwickia chelonae]